MESTNIPVEIEAKFKQATVKGGVAVLQFEVDTEDSAAFEAIRKSGEERSEEHTSELQSQR